MKGFFIITIAFFLAACNKDTKPADCGIQVDPGNESRQISVLFIGTSHTHYNDLPGLVRQIAQSVGDSVYTEMSAPGGFDFERHYKLPETISALNSRKWDYIVLQESGWRSALYPTVAEKMIYPFADSLQQVILKNNGSARLILYMTNGYIGGVNAFGDTAWCKADPGVCDFNGMQERIKDNYLHLAKQLKAEIAPCGLIWKILRSKNNNIVLHDRDSIHPALTGSYSNAITIYSMIKKQKLNGAFSPAILGKEQASAIQETVAAVLFDCNPGWQNF
jgi:hypothetical protein